MNARHPITTGVKSLLRAAGFDLKRIAHDWSDPRNYIPFEDTIRGAEQSGLSVADYVEQTHNVPGSASASRD